MTERAAKDVIEELFRRVASGDRSAIDELVAPDMVNHAAGTSGPQGSEGWKQILAVIDDDLAPHELVTHHLFGEGDLVTLHMTMRGRHQDSTMPLLQGVPVSGNEVGWTYIHICRVADGRMVEHWACRDDVGLLRQVGAWPPK